MSHKRHLIAAAVLLTLASAPAWSALERVGPVDHAPAVGGFPAWFQDKSGVALEFCAPSTLAELEGGWCLLLPGDAVVPESFPANFFDEHFYWAADNVLDDGNGFRAKLVLALEAAFANGAPAAGDQMVFGRMRVQTGDLPVAGDYRVITPFSDVTYFDVQAGQRIFDTLDIGTSCPTTFECTLTAPIGPFLLPSATAGGAEVPPMPDLASAPLGTDPFFDLLVTAGGGATTDAGTGKKYIADPSRVGPVTGSPLGTFTAFNTDGTETERNHNTFRIEVRRSTPTRDGAVFLVLDGETNFSLMGRLMTGTLAGRVGNGRAVYTADATGNVTALDVFTSATPTTVARLPAQPVQPPVQPILSVFDVPCAGAITVDPVTGATTVNPGPYSAPAATPHTMLATDTDYWAQSQPGGLPPSHVCIVDETARNAEGQVIPAYYLRKVTDEVTINSAAFNGANNGTLTVTAVSSDPTAVLTLGGYGPATAPGTSVSKGAGTGLELLAGSATVTALQAPPSAVQVVSSKGGASQRNTLAAAGAPPVLSGVPTALADSASTSEDAGPVTVDLLANDVISLDGTVTTLRNVVNGNLGTVVVTAGPARLGTASVSADGILTYAANANANGADSVAYSVAFNGAASNTAQATINIAAVNDAPVAGNVSVGGVVGTQNMINLIGTSTDVDAPGDVKDAVIVTWPPELGPVPVPVNGVIAYTPAAQGTHTFTFRVNDVAGALSANTGIGTVIASPNEVITFGKHQYVQNKNRWTVNGSDNIIVGQTITVVYENGLLNGATVPCNGTATNPSCVVGTSLVDRLGNWGFDKVNVSGALNPRGGATIWATPPTHIRAFSTLPSLGGTVAIDIVFK